MLKYRPPLRDEESKELVRLSKLDFSTWSEADVREEFLVEILKILGYRKELDYSVSREESFKLHPMFLSVGSNRVKLDYICSLRKQYFWIIDAKEGRCADKATAPEIDKKAIGQAHFYSLHPEVNCRYFIVSNGWYTNLYERDNLDEECTPKLSLRHTEFPQRFLELDALVGATQILPGIKQSILDQIDKVFSAEIRVERLDEFVEEVQIHAGKFRGTVQKAGAAYFHQAVTGAGGLFKAIMEDDLSGMTQLIFESARNKLYLEAVSRQVLRRLEVNRKEHLFKEYFFFSNLILEKAKPISFWYYPNVLYFFLEALPVIPGPLYFGQQTVDTLLRQWLDLCLFGLSPRKELRYMWMFERLWVRLMKRSIISLRGFREVVKEALDKRLFFVPEELLAKVGANEAGMLIDMVDQAAAFVRSEALRKYYSDRGEEFRTALASEEYRELLFFDTGFQEKFGEEYQKKKGSWVRTGQKLSYSRI